MPTRLRVGVALIATVAVLAGCGSAPRRSHPSPSPSTLPRVAAVGPATDLPPLSGAAPRVETPTRTSGVTPAPSAGHRAWPTPVPLPAPSATAVPSIALVRPLSAAVRPNRAASGNWSGYVAGGSLGEVEGSWTEPVATCPTATSTAAFWVGLGGAPSYPLYQAGSGVLCRSGVPVHVLWYEAVAQAGPQSQVVVREISAGDDVTAAVDLGDGTAGEIRLSDGTSGWAMTIRLSPRVTTLSTAEWIAEATTTASTGQVATLADFGAVSFRDCSVDHGQSGLASWPSRQVTALTLEDGGGGTATPGPLAAVAGGGFSVTYGA
jgi:Peptidase A4 family